MKTKFIEISIGQYINVYVLEYVSSRGNSSFNYFTKMHYPGYKILFHDFFGSRFLKHLEKVKLLTIKEVFIFLFFFSITSSTQT